MHAAIQSCLCARLLLRLRGAYNQISDVTIISTNRAVRSSSNRPVREDTAVWRGPQAQLDSVDYIAMSELESTTTAYSKQAPL